MNKLFKIILIGALLSFNGCALFRNPTGSWDKATSKLETTQKKIDQNEDKTKAQGRNYVYATKVALSFDTNTNIYHTVETELIDKAVTTLGVPPMEDTVYLQEMVKNLTSENAKLADKGQKQLSELDAKVIDLQQENTNLQSKLEKAEAKVIKVGTVNAGYASKWTSLVKIFWWIVYGFIAITVIRILSAVLPPPYNSIAGIINVPIGLFTKFIHALVPGAKSVAGVVHQDYKVATEQLVTSLQQIKQQHPDLHPEISQIVSNNVDSNIVPTINSVKSDLKITS